MGTGHARRLRRWTLPIAMMMATLLTGCLSTQVRVWRADGFHPDGQLHYRWGSAPLRAAGGVSPDMVVIDGVVREQVDRALAGKGYIEGGAADIEIDYRVGGETLVSRPGPLSPRDVGERIRAGPNAEYQVSSDFTTHRVLDVLEIRRIKVTALDTRTQKMVWEGVASRPVDAADSTASAVARSVRIAVDKLMRRFPAAALGTSADGR